MPRDIAVPAASNSVIAELPTVSAEVVPSSASVSVVTSELAARVSSGNEAEV